MVGTGPIHGAGTALISGARLVHRRDFLKAAGLAGVGIAAAPHLATWGGGSVLGGRSAAAADASDPVGALAAALDYDAERIFRFVADEIRYEPYSGILRGPRGTLASRAGNSADQALLLAALLNASLLPVRFATGELDGDTADTLLAGTVADADTIRQHALGALAGTTPGQVPPAVQLTDEQQAQLNEAVANSDRVVSWARDQLERTVGTITSALEEAGVELLDGFTRLPDSERARHVWVQLAQTADWIDLDPTIPGAAAGAALTSAAETLDALPEDLAHRVELAVIGETLTGGTLSERVLLGYSERADVLAGLPMTVTNAAPEALAALGVSVAGAIGGGVSYVPVIVVGEDAVVGANPIHLAIADATAATPGTGADFLEPGPGDGETTAEWAVLTIRSPEAEPVVVRRELFDRIGPAQRAAGDITATDLAPVDRIDLPDGTKDQALPALTMHWLTISTGLPSRDDPVMAVVPDEDVSDRAIVSQAFRLASAAADLQLAVPAGFRTFIDAPNVMAHSLAMRPAPDGTHTIESVLDIWHRSHGTAPVAGVTSSLPPTIAAGVLAHAAERVLGGEAMRNENDVTVFASTGAVFDATAALDIPLRVLRGVGAAADLPWDEDTRARLETALSDGWVAIAPERSVTIGTRERVGWWLVDPRTGRTIDQLDDGRGADMTERTIIITRVALRNAAAKQRFGICLAGVVLAVLEGIFLYIAQAELASGNTLEGVLWGGASAGGGLGGSAMLAC